MLLVIETTTAACSVALLDREQIIDERHEMVGRGHAERLVPMIEELLGGRRPSAILVDCGPGSFTGIRVGLAAAHGLAIGWGVPLDGFTSTALLAAGAAARGAATGAIAIALTGGHGQLFVQSYQGDTIHALDALRSLDPEEAAAVIAAHDVFGSGAAILVAARGHGAAHEASVRAADAHLIPGRLRCLAPRPIYGRAPDAKPMRP